MQCNAVWDGLGEMHGGTSRMRHKSTHGKITETIHFYSSSAPFTLPSIVPQPPGGETKTGNGSVDCTTHLLVEEASSATQRSPSVLRQMILSSHVSPDWHDVQRCLLGNTFIGRAKNFRREASDAAPLIGEEGGGLREGEDQSQSLGGR